MGAKPTTIGGGSARGVSDEFSKFLLQGLSGGFSAPQLGQTTAGDAMGRTNPLGSTMNIGQAIATMLNGGDNIANGALAIANNRREENVSNLRSRYALGGTGYGTPAATAESRFLGEFDPQVAAQVGQLRLDSIGRALSMLFPLYQQAYGLGTPQAQTVMKPSGFQQALSVGSQIAQAAAPFVMGAPFAAKSVATQGVPGGQLGQASNYHFDNGGFIPNIAGNIGDYYNGFGPRRDSFGTDFSYLR